MIDIESYFGNFQPKPLKMYYIPYNMGSQSILETF